MHSLCTKHVFLFLSTQPFAILHLATLSAITAYVLASIVLLLMERNAYSYMLKMKCPPLSAAVDWGRCRQHSCEIGSLRRRKAFRRIHYSRWGQVGQRVAIWQWFKIECRLVCCSIQQVGRRRRTRASRTVWVGRESLCARCATRHAARHHSLLPVPEDIPLRVHHSSTIRWEQYERCCNNNSIRFSGD